MIDSAGYMRKMEWAEFFDSRGTYEFTNKEPVKVGSDDTLCMCLTKKEDSLLICSLETLIVYNIKTKNLIK